MNRHKSSSSRLDRSALAFKPLAARINKRHIERDFISPDRAPGSLPPQKERLVLECAERIISARSINAPVIMAFGAHAIKNGLGLVLKELIEGGWVTHLATNGAGIIHDWEFAFQGMTGEDVCANMREGQFGLWQETGFFINLAINIGAHAGKGYGDSVGAMIHDERLVLPSVEDLLDESRRCLEDAPSQAAAAAALAGVLRAFNLDAGELSVSHPWKSHSVQAAAFAKGIPFTGHPMIGHDIIYCHPMNNGPLLGAASLRDFLSFAESVSRINNGVYLSVGSAVMSPMIFEKSLSMARNLARRQGGDINNYYIFVADLAQSDWDWSRGEPPEDNPAYYLRYNKTFSRMGGLHRYISIDNRDFLLTLYHRLATSGR